MCLSFQRNITVASVQASVTPVSLGLVMIAVFGVQQIYLTGFDWCDWCGCWLDCQAPEVLHSFYA